VKNKFIAIIPARGGSKGLPKKNIKKLFDYPLLSYSITASNLSKKISQTIVSTDSKEIANISKKYGADVPFLRPKNISKDSSTDYEFIEHAINWFEKNKKYVPEYWVILRPTTPIRNPELIDKAINYILKNKDCSSLVSVHEISETPAKMFGMNGKYLNGLCPFDPRKEYYILPRQEFPPTYSGNGYIDIISTKTILISKMLYGNKILGFDTGFVNEIDNHNDFEVLENTYLNKKNKLIDYLKKNFD
tara:strand:+ start:837 stop:1577 length:741 start_codon:yes stop_codon:yes gene_type:complete